MPDGPDVDGCDATMDNTDYDNDDTSELRALFPDGDPSKEAEWRELWKDPQT